MLAERGKFSDQLPENQLICMWVIGKSMTYIHVHDFSRLYYLFFVNQSIINFKPIL